MKIEFLLNPVDEPPCSRVSPPGESHVSHKGNNPPNKSQLAAECATLATESRVSAETTTNPATVSRVSAENTTTPSESQVPQERDTSPPSESHVAQNSAPPSESHVAQDSAPPNESHVAQDSAPPSESHVAQDSAPPSESHVSAQRTTSPSESHISPKRAILPPGSAAKQDKVPKDGFVSEKGKPRLSVQYPAYEVRKDLDLAPELDRYSVKPDQTMGRFVEYPRYIPYTSAKRGLQKKAGLKGFNVFQYEFLMPGGAGKPSKRHLVLWDYHVGLVRITPFFKALDYGKTAPKRAVDLNGGLEELTISITGGSLAAQGYWMPFECAKALVCTFCYPIRHVLAPLFGREIIDECLPFDDPAYGKFLINPVIIKHCTADVHEMQRAEGIDVPIYGYSTAPDSPYIDHATASAPPTPFLPRSLRSHTAKVLHDSSSENGPSSSGDQHNSSNKRKDSTPVSPKTAPLDLQPNDKRQADCPETAGTVAASKPTSVTHTTTSTKRKCLSSRRMKHKSRHSGSEKHKSKNSESEKHKGDNAGSEKPKTALTVDDILDVVLTVPDAEFVLKKYPAADIEDAVNLIRMCRRGRALKEEASNGSNPPAPPAIVITAPADVDGSSQTVEGPKSPSKKRVAADAFGDNIEVDKSSKKPDRRQAE